MGLICNSLKSKVFICFLAIWISSFVKYRSLVPIFLLGNFMKLKLCLQSDKEELVAMEYTVKGKTLSFLYIP